ncbi:MAG: Beta-lactamase precursor [Chloroflexi bacterium ADurb.Bin180]|nr:MAG: Beta-lactamase precursor [Chloroflexi bacterium ADurb.Bin180]
MRRDRIAEDIYTFSSDVYAQVTSGVILTTEGTIVIDTLPFPEETRQVLAFARERGKGPVRYVINTHHHSDHTNGNFLFPEAEVIGHRLCRQKMLTSGVRTLAEAKREQPELNEVELRPPNVVFEHDVYVHLGGRALCLTPLPGHTEDSIGVMIEGDRILFSGDAVLPVPHVVWGDPEEMIRSLKAVRTLKPESVIQGHGDLLLKGELVDEIESSIHYLECVTTRVRELVQKRAPTSALLEIDIESCGKSRVPLDGLVQFLHRDNLLALYHKYQAAERPRKPAS